MLETSRSSSTQKDGLEISGSVYVLNGSVCGHVSYLWSCIIASDLVVLSSILRVHQVLDRLFNLETQSLILALTSLIYRHSTLETVIFPSSNTKLTVAGSSRGGFQGKFCELFGIVLRVCLWGEIVRIGFTKRAFDTAENVLRSMCELSHVCGRYVYLVRSRRQMQRMGRFRGS